MENVANDTVLARTLAEARAMARHGPLWAALAGATLIVALTGPFGTYTTMPLPLRLAYWAGVVVTTFWIGALGSFAAASGAEDRGIPAPWSVVLGALASSLPVAAWIAAIHALVLDAAFGAEALRLLPYVAIIGTAVAFLYEALQARPEAARGGDAPPAPPAWLDRLPTELGRELVLLQAQDHYVRAETARGATLLRATIREAEEALGPYGLRVHRSWWVARAAIRSYRHAQGAPVVVLSTGQEIPVGRTYRRAVRAAIRQADAA